MGKYIAVQGCTLECTPAATAQIATSPSTTTKADGKACYRGSLTITVTNATAVTDGNGAGSEDRRAACGAGGGQGSNHRFRNFRRESGFRYGDS